MVLPWLALIFALLGMRSWDPVIPISLLFILFAFWAINWLAHHLSLRWLRYLRHLLWVVPLITIIVVPELRALFEELIQDLLLLESGTLIVLSIVTVIAWAVIGLARPKQQPNS
jgi:hypothetical protein